MAVSALFRRFPSLKALPWVGLAAVLASQAHAAPRPLFKASANGQPDTLEVYVLYVQFEKESDLEDEVSTTGNGTFGSDKTKHTYTLDPSGNLRSRPDYLLKHFQFANNYFNKVSNGRVVIVPRIYPDAANPRILQLEKSMKNYNPAIEDKSAKQKTRDFEESRAVQLMSFVRETALKAVGGPNDTASDPFRAARREAAANPSPNKKRAFLIFHAGHSRLVDGGSLGYLGANSPNDFTDFFVTKDDFKWLAKSTDVNARKDSLGIVVASGDTIRQFMMLSESANQDKINWGVNGILINQLARQMGMPDLFDVVKGISQVGYFDVMDFAGYNTMNGFLPVFPSAWVRAYMGWDEPVVARPGTAAFTDYVIHAADRPAPGRTRTVKIPINEREYLLVENRQRAGGDTTVTVFFSTRSNMETGTVFDRDSVRTVPYAKIDSLFLDSTCQTYNNNGSCSKKVPNPLKPHGVITGASHYDMGLPGNGLLVWHVNEWFLESFLPYGAVNAYLGDTLRSQYKGLELTEADGVPSIGKEFTDPLGQPAFDYGTSQDFLPHVYRERKNPPKDTTWAPAETLTVIGSYGFANTNSWNDGRTHIQLQALIPASPRLSKGVSGFSGDSVFNLRDSAITLRVIWPGNNTVRQPAGSEWPVRTAAAGNPQAINLIRDGAGRAFVVSASDSGLLQTYTAQGKLALAARDTVRDSAKYEDVEALLSSGNTRPENAAPVNSLVDPAGAPLGVAVISDSVLAVLGGQSLRIVRARGDSLNGASRNGGLDTTLALKGRAGPIAWDGKVFAVDSAGVLHGYTPAGTSAFAPVAFPPATYQALAGLVFGGANHVVAVDSLGRVVRLPAAGGAPVSLNPQWGDWTFGAGERFTLSVSDFNRDGEDDIFVLGSKGSALLMEARQDKQGQAFMGWPQRLNRSTMLSDTLGNYETEDRSGPALTDLDRDGRPDIVFSGTNAVYALDWRGAPLRGWPFRMQPRQPVGFTYANRLFPATVIGSTPLAVNLRGKPAILVSSPDGLIYAVDSAGRKITYTSFEPAQKKGTGVLMSDLSDWPLSVGGISLDSLRAPYVQISMLALDSANGARALVAQTATGSLNAWSLPGLANHAADWSMPGGNLARTSRLDAEALAAAAAITPTETLEEFHLFPSPVRNGRATVHLKLGAPAASARIRIFDIAGKMVKDEVLTGLNAGVQPYNRVLDLRHLGPDVYSVTCEVSFPGGKKTKWQRLGVVK
jgi:M6 family metalloprotease-like protein